MKYIPPFIFLFIASCAIAQKPDQVLARVNYIFTNTSDTISQNGKTREENMILFVGKDASLYTSLNKIKYNIAQDYKDQMDAMRRIGQTGSPSVVIIDDSPSDWMSKTDYIFLFKANQFFEKEYHFYQPYLIEQALPHIDWKIEKDTASFAGISCQKATATINNRNWIVWFAPSLPFQSGPWKLNGLPGLIISASDESKSIQFKFDGFVNAKENDFRRLNDITKKSDFVPGSGRFNNVDILLGRDVAWAYFENTIKLPPNVVKTNRTDLNRMKTKRNLKIQPDFRIQKSHHKIGFKTSSELKTIKAQINTGKSLFLRRSK